MLLNRAIKMQMYPDDEQRHKIDVTLSHCRYIYNGKGVKIVPKTLRVAKAKDEVKVKVDKNCYEITEDTHTKTGDKIGVVKLTKDLSRENYLKEKSVMKDKGGYYSKFKHGFVFKERPCF